MAGLNREALSHQERRQQRRAMHVRANELMADPVIVEQIATRVQAGETPPDLAREYGITYQDMLALVHFAGLRWHRMSRRWEQRNETHEREDTITD
jgi:uncharacterized membrane-anchored protein